MRYFSPLSPARKKAQTWLLLALFAFGFTACSEDCETTISVRTMEPVLMQVSDIRAGVSSGPARSLESPGKIYIKGDYLFINEKKKGLHIIDNANPAAPQNIAFITIPGNADMAVWGNILYADSYQDLVAFDITNPKSIHLVKRVEDVFKSMYNYQYTTTGVNNNVLVDYVEKIVTRVEKSDCNGGGSPNVQPITNGGWGSGFDMAAASPTFFSAERSSLGAGSGTGGSMARFAIYDKYLYAVTHTQMQLFDIGESVHPTPVATVNLGWGIETIFPHGDKLFIGSNSGMHIYDNVNPVSPQHLSTYSHATVCDPVVVDGKYAYVTLRSGNQCQGFTNQLDLVNISDLRKPVLEKTFPMLNPHGLGIDNNTLFLCEGSYGLKTFSLKNPLNLDRNLLEHFKNLDAYDVIPMNNVLMMIGKDGLYQYDYSNTRDLKLLSKIPVKPAS